MRTSCQLRFALSFCALLSLLASSSARAQVLPPPPVSPAPVVGLEYDAVGNSTKRIAAPGVLNFSTATPRDRLHRIKLMTDARGKDTQLGYNGTDALTQVIDPRLLTTSYSRNGLNDLTALTSPDTGTSSPIVYDAAGNLQSVTDSRGVVATYAYDDISRLTSVSYAQSGQPTQTFSWIYDQTGAGFTYGRGRLTSISFPSGSATFAYDPLGRLTSTTQTVVSDNTVNLITSYQYDAAGRISSITYPSGRVLSIARAGGLPTSLSLTPSGGGTAITLLSDLLYEPAPGGEGVPRSWNWQLTSGTLAHVRVFDSYGRMVRHPLGGAVRDITYDSADRIIAFTHLDASSGASVPALNQGFSYDELGRLTGLTSTAGNWTFDYDDNGNRRLVAEVIGGVSTTRNYTTAPTSNRLQSLDNPGRSLTHDAAGNTVQDQEGTRTEAFTIDPSGRISRLNATSNGLSYAFTGYVYNNLGQRILKKDLGGETCSGPPGSPRVCDPILVAGGIGIVFVYDQAGHLLGEYSLQNGTMLREYIWLDDLPVAVTINDTRTGAPIYYIQTDHLNTPRVMLDQLGRQRWTWVSEPFGNGLPNENPLGFGPVGLNLRMPGQYFDVESGLAYNWNRSYDATVGRYTQSDPIGLQGGSNTYAYVGGNPLSYSDPLGLAPDIRVCVNGVCSSPPPPVWKPDNPRPAPPALPDLTKPSPYLPTWNWDGITWPSRSSPPAASSRRPQAAIPPAAAAGAPFCRESNEADRCRQQLAICRQTCQAKWERGDPPFSGSDVPGRMRRCIRECMEAAGCSNF